MQKISGCLFADDVSYDVPRDVWVRPEGGLYVVGVDSVRAWISGVLTSVTLKPTGTVLERGVSLGATEGPRHFDVVRSPLSGVVVEVNPELSANPRLVNTDPYGEGWLAKIRPSRLDDERTGLKSISSASGALAEKVNRLKVRCFDAFPDYEMFEIGSECAGVLVKLDELIARSPVGTVVHLVSDDVTAEIELITWSDRTGQKLIETRKEGNLFHFIVKKTR